MAVLNKEYNKFDKEIRLNRSRKDSLKKSSRSSSVILDTLQSLNRELVEESIMNSIKSLER